MQLDNMRRFVATRTTTRWVRAQGDVELKAIKNMGVDLSRKLVDSERYGFLKQVKPLMQPEAPPLVCWEYLYNVSRLLKEEDKRLSEGGQPMLSNVWRMKYSREVSCIESMDDKLVQLHSAAALLDDPDKDVQALAMDEIQELGSALLEDCEALRKVTAAVLRLNDAIGSASDKWTVEVVGRAGGEEAHIFANDLFGCLFRYAKAMEWRPKDLSNSEGQLLMSLTGEGIYERMRYEIGTHRIQRIPSTEASGRMQTSTCSVLLMPSPDPLSVNVRIEDCDVEMARGGGPGGQGVNSSSNCAHVHHRPSGKRATKHIDRSGNANIQYALEDIAQQIWREQIQSQKKTMDTLFNSQFGSGERGERIRTYNHPQNRVTDHRIMKDYLFSNWFEGTEPITDSHNILYQQYFTKAVFNALSDVIEAKLPEY